MLSNEKVRGIIQRNDVETRRELIQPIIFQNTDYILCSVFVAEYLGLYNGTLEKIYVKKRFYQTSY